MKLHYFNFYGRAEAIRMALWKAGVNFEDIQNSYQEWMEMEASGEFPLEYLPSLELDDGTIIA